MATPSSKVAATSSRQRWFSNDVLGHVLGYLSPEEAWQSSAITKAWLEPRERALRGKLRVVRRIGPFGYDGGLTAVPYGKSDGGVLVADYGADCLKGFSRQGDFMGVACTKEGSEWVIRTPTAIALRSDKDCWVLESDPCSVVLMDAITVDRLMELDTFRFRPKDLAVAGEKLLVLYDFDFNDSDDESDSDGGPSGGISVYDVETGEYRFRFGCTDPGNVEQTLDCPSSLAVGGDLVFVADPHVNAIKVFNHETGAFVRMLGGIADSHLSSIPPPGGEFHYPFGVAVGHGRLYVSEQGSPRLQVLDLDGTPLQTIVSPDGQPLGRMCIEDENVWCLGSEEGPTYGHIFAPFLLDPAVALARCRARAKLPEAARRKQAEEAARLERAEKATREFVLAHSDLVEGTAAFNAAVTAAREFAKTSREFKGHRT